MELLERKRLFEFLGRDFLVWLWFKSETNGGKFDLNEIGLIDLSLDNKIILQSESTVYEEEQLETVTCTGNNPDLKEARFALAENKKIIQVMVKISQGDNEWSLVLDSTWMNFKSFKTPKVMQDENDDKEGLFYEKMYLTNQALTIMNAVFYSFIKLRISSEWNSKELQDLNKWIFEGR